MAPGPPKQDTKTNDNKEPFNTDLKDLIDTNYPAIKPLSEYFGNQRGGWFIVPDYDLGNCIPLALGLDETSSEEFTAYRNWILRVAGIGSDDDGFRRFAYAMDDWYREQADSWETAAREVKKGYREEFQALSKLHSELKGEHEDLLMSVKKGKNKDLTEDEGELAR